MDHLLGVAREPLVRINYASRYLTVNAHTFFSKKKEREDRKRGAESDNIADTMVRKYFNLNAHPYTAPRHSIDAFNPRVAH